MNHYNKRCYIIFILREAWGGEQNMEKAYQSKMKDGFTLNKLLKKPNVKGGVIYNIVEKETTLLRGDYFLPIWDSTDHLQFACQKCKSTADILRIKIDANYAKPPNPKYALFFYLACPSCGASGQRKIYLDLTFAKWSNQIAFEDGKIYVYGNERKPIRVLEVDAKKSEGDTD
jgi:hypothetical protein